MHDFSCIYIYCVYMNYRLTYTRPSTFVQVYTCIYMYLSTLSTLPPQSSVDVSVWNTQCLVSRLLGVDQSRLRGETERSESSSRSATIQEVDEEEEEEDCEVWSDCTVQEKTHFEMLN